MDTLERPVIDDLTHLEYDESEDKNCDHPSHDSGSNHSGPAAWWMESKCRACGCIWRGRRCDEYKVFTEFLLATLYAVLDIGMYCHSCHANAHHNPHYYPIED